MNPLHLLLLISLPAAAPAENAFTPREWKESGVTDTIRSMRPMNVILSPTAPTGLSKVPENLTGPLYGSFITGPEKEQLTHAFIQEFAEGKMLRMHVDANGNGDLTDDPACPVTSSDYERPDGARTTTDHASAMVTLGSGSDRRGNVKFYQPRPAAGTLPRAISWHTDFGLAGEISVEGKSYPAILVDGDGQGSWSLEGRVGTAPLLWVDAKGDGRGRTFSASRPMELSGQWWKAAEMKPDGSFRLAAAEKPAEPKHEGPDLSPGQKAPAFTAKLTGGKEVKFPDDYKGRVVLLDFWATWCGPCVAELPNVSKAWTAYHEKGFDVLGISLDKEGMEEKLNELTAKRQMPWPQAYEGKGWTSEVARLYGVRSIPHMILVDGDTGLILANKDIRGEALAPAIEKALAARKSAP